MTTTLKIDASHIFIYVDIMSVDLEVRKLGTYRNLKDFFRQLSYIARSYSQDAVKTYYDWEDMLDEIPVRATLASLKYKNGIFCLTLGEDSYVPWEIIMAIDSLSGPLYLAYDEPAEDRCYVYDPEHRLYPKDGYLLDVIGCGKEIHSFVRDTSDINTDFYNTYGYSLSPTDSMEAIEEELNSIPGIETVLIRRLTI